MIKAASVILALVAGVLLILWPGVRQTPTDQNSLSISQTHLSVTQSPNETAQPTRATASTPLEAPAPAIEDSLTTNERNAVAAMRVISVAEMDFHANDRDWNKVRDYWTLDVSGLYRFKAGPKPGRRIKLIDYEYAAGDVAPQPDSSQLGPPFPRKPWAGYWFRMLPATSAIGGRSLIEFAVVAYPAEYLPASRHTFLVNQKNLVLKKDLGGSAPTAWPAEEELSTWKDTAPLMSGSGARTQASLERSRAWSARDGFNGAHRPGVWNEKRDENDRFSETLGDALHLDETRWQALREAHKQLLDQAERLEAAKAQVHKEASRTIIHIPAFPQEGLAIATEWGRQLDSILTPEQKRKHSSLDAEFFPMLLGQYVTTFIIEPVMDEFRVEQIILLSNGEEIARTLLTDAIPQSCRHLLR